jgi:hypothetical protein
VVHGALIRHHLSTEIITKPWGTTRGNRIEHLPLVWLIIGVRTANPWHPEMQPTRFAIIDDRRVSRRGHQQLLLRLLWLLLWL